jgi:hypothetical protein
MSEKCKFVLKCVLNIAIGCFKGFCADKMAAKRTYYWCNGVNFLLREQCMVINNNYQTKMNSIHLMQY